MHPAVKLRALLKQPGIIKAVGAQDALSAKLIERAGFDAIWASGFAISASLKCIPDASFITSSEQLEVERNIAEAVSIPIIADCDTGYGNALNVMRTVNDRERAGVAAICIASMVRGLYISTNNAAHQYGRPLLLWAAVPIFLFWQSRMWLSASRGFMHDDPIVYAARDWVSQLCLALLLAVYVLATVPQL